MTSRANLTVIVIYIQYSLPEGRIRKEIGLQETHIAAGKHRKCAYLTLEAADYHQKLYKT